MTSSALLAGAIIALLVWGLHLPLLTALILTAIAMLVLLGNGFIGRRDRKVVIVQDLNTGKTHFQPMDNATRAYLATRKLEDN